MRQFHRGERAKLSELAAINHIWEVGISVDAPFFIVDFCCLALDVEGEVFDDRFLISYNQPDSPQNAIRMDNASNNGAIFTLNMGLLPDQARRVVFTATLHKPEMPGGILGAAFSMFGPDIDVGEGHLTLSTPAIDAAVFPFSGQDFGEESALILGEFYWRDEWRFVAAGQPLKGELDDFLRTLTDGPTPAPTPSPTPIASVKKSAPMAAPPRQPPAAPRPPISTPIALPAVIQAPISPIRAAAPSPVAPKIAAPAISLPAISLPAVSAPIAAPAVPVFPQALAPDEKLQDLIDAAAPGSTLTLMRDEYEGPIVIDKPLILEGRDSALWSKTGPVVRVAAADVALHNLDIEITILPALSDETGVALQVEGEAPRLRLDNVRVRGRIQGLGAEDGEWRLPAMLNLGQFAARAHNEFQFLVRVPTTVKLSSPVEGVSLLPTEIDAGEHQIKLHVRDVAPETLIMGFIELRSVSLLRTVSLGGNAVVGVEAKLGVTL